MANYIFTSESVSEGHPDKVADQISDAVLDAYLSEDPDSRVACESLVTTGLALVAGEVRSRARPNLQDIVRRTILKIGYDSAATGFDGNTCAVAITLGAQSPDIAQGVDQSTSASGEQGAGDQGLMFGYAIKETPELMPLSTALSHGIMKELAQQRKSKLVDFIWPDSKCQVSIEYENSKIKRIDTIVVSTQHTPDVKMETLKEYVIESVIKKTVPRELIDQKTKFHINPTGRFVVGGPHGDCGLTGRKIIVDTYGGHGAHGGGAFSGKDPSKVDRSAAYACRHIAKNLVASGLLDKCLVQVAYAIGVAEPVSLMINDYGTSHIGTEKLEAIVRKVWSLKPAAIVKRFDLLKPRYSITSSYGHFGRTEPEFTWERLDEVARIQDLAKA